MERDRGDRPVRVTRRRFLRGAAAASALSAAATPGALMAGSRAAAGLPAKAASAAQAQRFDGTTLNVFMFDHTYTRALQELLPQFTDLTGMVVNMETPGFAVYNQRADLELSTGSGAFDVMAMTFIFTGKWIGAGWVTNLNDFIAGDEAVGMDDFLTGALAPMKSGDDVFALPFVGESTLMVYRTDIFEAAGLQPPETFDQLLEQAPQLQTDTTKAYMGRGGPGFHWIWPNYLFAYDGAFFENPPDDLTPLLATPESIRSADVMGTLYREYSVPGVQSFAEPEATAAMMGGEAAIYIDTLGWTGLAASPDSTVRDRVAFALPPGGPAGRFPQVAAHGLLIPEGAEQKEASWEFVKWAASPEVMGQIALGSTYPSVTRASVLSLPEYKATYNWGGTDIGALHQEVLEAAGAGYMAYRTIPEFPPIGDRVAIALSEISTGQRSAEEAMEAAQNDVVGILEQAGYDI